MLAFTLFSCAGRSCLFHPSVASTSALSFLSTLLVCSLLSPQTCTPYSEVCILPVLQSGPTNYVDVHDLPSCTSSVGLLKVQCRVHVCLLDYVLTLHVYLFTFIFSLHLQSYLPPLSSPPVSLPSEFSQLPLQARLGYLLNVPATYVCTSATDLLRQFYVLPHWDRNFPSHPVTVCWHRANQSQR